MKTPVFYLVALAMSASAFSQTSVPAAPTLTAGAEFKGLRFDWNPVPGATRYELEYRAHQNSSFVQQGDDLAATATSTRFTFALHLYDWTYARYRLAACNSAGCSRSAEVSVSNLRRDAVGYFKAAQPVRNARFGGDVDISPDGYSYVVSAPGETTNYTDDFTDGGAVYAFQRGSNGDWVQRVRIDAQAHVETGSGIALEVATSGSGNTIAVGIPTDEHVPFDGRYGRVDIYHTNGTVWAHKTLPRTTSYTVGSSVGLSENGYILAVGLQDNDNSVAIWKSVNGVWQNLRNLPLNRTGDHYEFCGHALLSRDGKTVAELCNDGIGDTRRDYVRLFTGSNWTVRKEIELGPDSDGAYFANGFAIDATADTVAVQFNLPVDELEGTDGFVKVFKRSSGVYSQAAKLSPGAWRNDTIRRLYGDSISLSGDGSTLTVGDTYDNGNGFGPRAAPLSSGTAATGAVYVYRLTDSWKLANMVKPNYYPGPGTSFFFGDVAALSNTGRTLLVATPGESSTAKGIDGDWANDDGPANAGAVFMY